MLDFRGSRIVFASSWYRCEVHLFRSTILLLSTLAVALSGARSHSGQRRRQHRPPPLGRPHPTSSCSTMASARSHSGTGVELLLRGSLVLVFTTREGTEVFTSWSYGLDPLTATLSTIALWDQLLKASVSVRVKRASSMCMAQRFRSSTTRLSIRPRSRLSELTRHYSRRNSIERERAGWSTSWNQHRAVNSQVSGAKRPRWNSTEVLPHRGSSLKCVDTSEPVHVGFPTPPGCPLNRSSRGWNTPLSCAPLVPLRLGSSVRPVVG
jgi:hypothetical protein